MTTPSLYVSRAEWGARPRGASPRTHPIGSTRGVTFHWEGPHMGDFPHTACGGKVRGIEAFHRDSRGWADIAYNALVCPHGYVFEGRGVWTMSAANGYTSVNSDWYAVCYLGGEGDPFTDQARTAYAEAVTWLRTEGGAGDEVNGHRDHKSTECPGDAIYAYAHSHDFDAPPNPQEEDDMFTDADRKMLKDTAADAERARSGSYKRDEVILDALQALAEGDEQIKARVTKAKRELADLIAADNAAEVLP